MTTPLNTFPSSMVELLSGSHTTNTFLFFNGTGLDCLMSKESAIKNADVGIKDMLSRFSMSFLKKELYSRLEQKEAELRKQFPDGHTMKQVLKFWGGDAFENFIEWQTSIIFLLKTKVVQNDDNNGWLVIALPIGSNKTVKLRKLFQYCGGCGKCANFKTCSGCKKVHYCSTECQNAHWKTHKPDCSK